jgi:RsmE family RNA methyltransferase
MNRIVLALDELREDGVVILQDRRAGHIRRVLGSRTGDRLRIGLRDGPRGTATVMGIDPDGVQLHCRLDQPPLPPTGITLLLALPRPKVMHRLWAPLASLGVDGIVLVNAEKVERNYFDTHWIDPAAYEPLLLEGIEQSGDTRLPRVRVCRRFKPFIEDESATFFGEATRLVFHPLEAVPLSAEAMPPAKPVVIAIGPEGGWSDYEIDLLRQHGFACVSFGTRTLRTDTAVQAILGAVMLLRAPSPAG